MEKKQIRIEKPVIISGLTVWPVVQTSIIARPDQTGVYFFGWKKPLYLLLKQPGLPVKVFTITREEVALSRIAAQYPEIKSQLTQMQF